MRVKTSVSFEHNLKPVLTVRDEFDTVDFETANKTALFRAVKQQKRVNARSVVVVIEQID